MSDVKNFTTAAPQSPPAAGNRADESEVRRRRQADGGSRGASSSPASQPTARTLLGLALIATGVVFGDIATSPLYAFRMTFGPEVGLAPTADHALGVASLIFWSLTLVVSIKYLLLAFRADHDGEGGILALLALSRPWRHERVRPFLIVAGLFGAALLYADGVITPAISVLSAVEGIAAVDAAYTPVALPATFAVLLVLFVLQHRGTVGVGKLFGPLMATWLVAIALLGFAQIARQPQVLAAVSPTYAIGLLLESGWQALLVLGTMFLALTGAEALYADLGHFGRRPIRVAWYGLAYPSLLLSYFGQAALALEAPDLAPRSFYALAPSWALWPLIALATAATCIASQSIISGAFSLTRQAIRLGYLPKMRIVQTSAGRVGRVYVPAINWFLMVVTLIFVVGFGSSDSLAGAFGLAVSGTMLITTLLLSVVTIDRWSWPVPVAVAVALPFFMLDTLYVAGNMLKIASGGWAPLLIAGIACQLMIIWRAGERTLNQMVRSRTPNLESFEARLKEPSLLRVPGTGVFLSRTGESPPLVLTRVVERLGTLHERAVLLTVAQEQVPRVKPALRLAIKDLGNGLYLAQLRYGFMEMPDIPNALRLAKLNGRPIDVDEVTYFILHNIPQVSERAGLQAWRQRLYAALERNFEGYQHDNIPAERTFTVGIPLYLPSQVPQTRGLKMRTRGGRRDRGSRVGMHGAA